MAHKSTTLSVMLSSPDDVRNRGVIVLLNQTISDWNSLHSDNEKVTLVAKDWKAAYPEMGIGEGQKAINEQILNPCDILIAIFWSQIGNPTKKFASGTIEEIETHILAGKPAMVYFLNGPYPTGCDPKQLEKLQAYKDHCKERGLYKEIDQLGDSLKLIIMADILRCIRDKFPTAAIESTDVAPAGKKVIVPPVVIAALKSSPKVELTETSSRPDLLGLSPEALEMLSLAASYDDYPIIYLSGEHFKIGPRFLGKESGQPDMATWQKAFLELCKGGLIYPPLDHPGELPPGGKLYSLSKSGIELAGKIKETSAQQIQTALDAQSSRNLLLRNINSLSEEAEEMLLAASINDNDGKIMKKKYMSGKFFWVASQKMGHKTERDFARYDAALDSLARSGFVRSSNSSQGPIFYLTDDGWKAANLLRYLADSK